MSDKDRVLTYLEEHGSITPMEALTEFGCYRLGARIWDLRHAGHSISTEMVERRDRNGDRERYARYRLTEARQERRV